MVFLFFNLALALLRIHLLHQHGFESAEKTSRTSLPVSANLVGAYDETVGASSARPLLLQGQFALTHLPIHLFQVLGYEAADKTAAVRYRVGAAKPTSVVRGALPQRQLRRVDWLPLEGKLSAIAD